ncbi:hypothetical protein AB0I22_38100 [Streptomyces sp. NPDC050610]|uniref:hypothetical protein n=1 Tax=Streptomyces sp. NPDC050610 TaxID=3157097 RepID=UPI003432EBED
MSILAAFALAVVVIGGIPGTGSGGSGKTPRPEKSTGAYPVKLPGWKAPAPRPRPTPHYPIKWDRG